MNVILTPPAELERASCKSCGRPIVWARTQKGKAMPLDLARSPDGNLILYGEPSLSTGDVRPPYQVTACTPEDREHLGSVDLWISHFATCPSAAAHRRAK